MCAATCADVFATKVEGIKGKQAVEWGLVDTIAPPTAFAELVRTRALARAAESDRPDDAEGVELGPIAHRFVSVERSEIAATITVRAFGSLEESLEACRELDTPSSTFASTIPTSARGSSAPRGGSTTCSPPTAPSAVTAGWSARCGSTGGAR